MLTGPQIGKLRDAIMEVFTLPALTEFLNIRLEKNIANYAPGESMKYRVYVLVVEANMEGWHEELVNALISERPKSLSLINIATDLGIGFHLENAQNGAKINRSGLEALVNGDPSFDPAVLLQGISNNKRCVCRIQLANGATTFGTGFLVGPGILLSNYHVFETVIKDKSLSSKVRCRFDYEIGSDGKMINPGIEIGLDNIAPILASSAYSTNDVQGSTNIDDVDWPEDMLDYALIRLEREIGNEYFGPKGGTSNSEQRGWIKPGPSTPIYSGSHMIIMQHPDKEPIKITFGLSKVVGCDKKGVRVRYQINTMNGSSGSPGFDQNFNWISLHNMGDPSWNPKYNQGIPAAKIITDLASKGINL